MAYPTITFNSGTGSDTAASGSGGTAVTAGGNNSASTTAASTNVDLSADAPDLSGVSTDGTAVLWVASSSGRQFSVISAVDNSSKIVTCADTFANTESGKNWGIGGKRATIDAASSRTLFGTSGAKAGWTAVLEDDQSLTSLLTISVVGNTAADGRFVLKGDSVSTHRAITQTANANVISASGTHQEYRNLLIKHSNASKGNARGIQSDSGRMTLVANCILGDSSHTLTRGIYRSSGATQFTILNCEIKYCSICGIEQGAGVATGMSIKDCWIHNNAIGISSTNSGDVAIEVIGCVIADNTSDGLQFTQSSGPQAGALVIANNTIDGNGGDGIDFSTAAQGIGLICFNNIISNNSGYGFNGHSNIDRAVHFVDFNNYYNNTSGARNNLTAGANDQTVDPQFTDANNNDFSIGINLKAKGSPLNYIGFSSTYSYVDIGAAQRQEAGSGGPLIGSGRLIRIGG